ncbi:hypothetical protein FBUS_07243 [Fasciolopsis buskii]|uniref:Uncharacterized protein n=1 Tax=Fasciolopsis buskii TaxID=27845 RepID=A0A8E0RQY1_9TREM|nr:hypothetical protein FBUS_07243 [Fasciolopsis buski]
MNKGIWFLLLAGLLLYCVRLTTGAVASGLRFVDPNSFENQQNLLTKSIPEFSLAMQTPGQNLIPSDQSPMVQLVQQPVAAAQTMARFINPNDFLLSQTPAFPVQMTGHPALALGTNQVQSIMPTAATMSPADVDEVSSVTGINMVPSSSATIVGSPNDGVLGPDGQILGSAHDTAVVDAAGQISANLLQGKLSNDFRQNAAVGYAQGQLFPNPHILTPYSQIQGQQYPGVQIAYDAAGRPFLIQLPHFGN